MITDTHFPSGTDAYYDNLSATAISVIEDSLRQVRQTRVQGKQPQPHISLTDICKKISDCYPRGGSVSRPSFNLEFVDITLNASNTKILHILPYLLFSYILNYTGNDTMHPKIPYNQPDFKLEEQAYPYSLDRFMMYEDTHLWSYIDDGIDRDHRNYARAVKRQAQAFTLSPRTDSQKKHLNTQLLHIISLNKKGSRSEYSQLLWNIHIFCNIMIWCFEDLNLRHYISYKDSMQLVLRYFPFTQFEMINALWQHAQFCARGSDILSPVFFSSFYIGAISPQIITDLDLSRIPLTHISDRIAYALQLRQTPSGRWQVADTN